ncbi:MAG: hypothetical protein LBQ54_02775 [Planctomycetaceae bacterium]|jgi:hypothetical protein|nr:hypothetical protein [Planctomycetaceae bacterium]
MNFNRSDFVRAVKRITEATGYLELEMPQQALETLRCISVPGPFAAQIEFLCGKALQQNHQFEDAAVCLAAAAKDVPAPFQKEAFAYLTECLKESTNPQQTALESFGVFRGAKPTLTAHRFAGQSLPQSHASDADCN